VGIGVERIHLPVWAGALDQDAPELGFNEFGEHLSPERHEVRG